MYFHIIEFLSSLGLFVNAILFIPQALKIHRDKNAHNLSLVTFAGFNLIQLAIVLHGFLHQDWILVLGIGLSFITCGFVTLQIIYYKFFR